MYYYRTWKTRGPLMLDHSQLITDQKYLVSLSGISEPVWQINQKYFHWQSFALICPLPVETKLWNVTIVKNVMARGT
jgi:hypothetical protein